MHESAQMKSYYIRSNHKFFRLFSSGVLIVLQVCLLGYSVARWWSYRNNTLFGNGRWLIGKDMGKFVFYTWDFMFHPLRGYVNLSGHMGFQEILYRTPDSAHRRLLSADIEAEIARDGYLWIELNKQGLRMLGCRISRRVGYESGFFRYDDSGTLVEYIPFKHPVDAETEYFRLRVERLQSNWRLLVNGIVAGKVPDFGLPGDYFGFRGSGSSAAPVLLRKITMKFEDPSCPGKTWVEHEKFSARELFRSVFFPSTLFAFCILCLRRMRRVQFKSLIQENRLQLFTISDDLGILLLLVVTAVFRHPPASGLHLGLFLVTSELYSLIILALFAKCSESSGKVSLKMMPVVIYSVGVTLCFLISTMDGGPIWRRQPVLPEKMLGIHPASFKVRPCVSAPSPAFTLASPVIVLPGEPFFVEGRAYNSQSIGVEVVIPSNSTLDIVYQQQSYVTRGDESGEELPFQRRMVRLTTRHDVTWGLATRTRLTPMPFLRLNGEVFPDRTNHVEITSTPSGTRIKLNGKTTIYRNVQPIGLGETGFLCYEKPVRIEHLTIEPEGIQHSDTIWKYALIVLLPALFIFVLWIVLKLSGGIAFITAAGLEMSALYPLAVYLLAGVFLGLTNMIFIGHHRLLWLDLVLIAVAINHIAISLFLRRFIKKAFLLFNAGFLALLVLFAFTLWDLLPEEHALKLHFVHDAVAPADIFQKLPDEKSGPWYGSNRIIGANTYMWKQQFGGKKITRTKANGVIRIFLVGGSQAWGSGARSSKETFCELLERRLRAKGLNVEFFNAGVNGAGTSKIARYYASLIRDFSPDILIADIGLNDSAALKQIRDPVKAGEQRRAILTDFTRLARLCKEDGVGLVLVLEPMCKECPLRPDKQLYDGFTEIAIAHGGTVLDPGELLSKREKDHIVWWDTAHLAPAGHHILAGFLELAVEKIVRARQLKMNPENTLHY